MQKVGIIGGLSPESTVLYYRGLNEGVRAALGGHHSAQILLSSVDFGVFYEHKQNNDWDSQAAILVGEAKALEAGGADFVVLATNTMHFAAPKIQEAISIPFLHIVDATAGPMTAAGITKAGFLGTKYAMELPFYPECLKERGIESIVPNDSDRADVNRIIYDELTKGIVRPESRQRYREVIADLVEQGAQAIILGCTEITMLVDDKDSPVPVYDTTACHIEAILAQIL